MGHDCGASVLNSSEVIIRAHQGLIGDVCHVSLKDIQQLSLSAPSFNKDHTHNSLGSRTQGFWFFLGGGWFFFFAASLESLAWFLLLVCHRLLEVSLTCFIFGLACAWKLGVSPTSTLPHLSLAMSPLSPFTEAIHFPHPNVSQRLMCE